MPTMISSLHNISAVEDYIANSPLQKSEKFLLINVVKGRFQIFTSLLNYSSLALL
jgi:hypothetical protein